MSRWLGNIAKCRAIDSYRRQVRRMKQVLFRQRLVAKMRDAREEDDLDLESLADESIAALQSLQPDDAMEQEEQASRLARFLEQSEDRATRLIYRRYIDGASYKQMAAEEHATGSNMRTRVSRAIASMRQILIDVYKEK